LEVVNQWQLARCGQNIVEWIKWRHEIMNGQPTDDMTSRLVTLLQSGPKGLFSVSTSLDINYPMAKKLLAEAHQRGIITTQGNRYKLCRVIDEVALEDLSLLREAAIASGR
jgi:DNA-binding transcriptional regulator LsrR (DeoR family)